MAQYSPSAPFSVSLRLLIPTYTKVNGVRKKTFPDTDGIAFFGSLKTYGGTERDVNGIYAVEDTAIIDTWYRPDIQSDCRIVVDGTNAVYDILGEPENINLRNQYLRIKVTRVKGGA